MRPLVSICIPCHNAVSYIGPALESSLAQTYSNIEVILVDDGSTDGSADVARQFRSRGVTLITENCGSAAKARNRALKEASGDYVKFFDADDVMSADHIRLQMERLDGREDAVASSEWGRFYNDDLSSFISNPQNVWRDMMATDWLVEAWYDARPMMQPGMFLIPRKILNQTGGWDEDLTLIDDFEFFARVLCHSRDVLFTPGAVLHYRSGLSGSLSQQKNDEAIRSAFHSVCRGTAHLLKCRNDQLARKSCANIFQDFIFTHYPRYKDLRKVLQNRILELGGSDLVPDGSPRFQLLCKVAGWRIARRVELTRKFFIPG